MQKQITDTLQKFLKQKNITQSHLASHLKCTQTAVSNLLNGRSRLTVDDLNSICDLLQISINELIAESTQVSYQPTHYPVSSENLLTKDALSFYLFNKLKHPVTIEEILTEFSNKKIQNKILKILATLIENNIVKKSLTDSTYYGIHDAGSPRIYHYTLNNEYSSRIFEIYKMQRNPVQKVINSPIELKKWKQHNIDSFYFEYFTEDQIKTQNEMLRQLLDLVKHQIRINSGSLKSENLKLRTIFVSSCPYPTSELQREIYE